MAGIASTAEVMCVGGQVELACGPDDYTDPLVINVTLNAPKGVKTLYDVTNGAAVVGPNGFTCVQEEEVAGPCWCTCDLIANDQLTPAGSSYTIRVQALDGSTIVCETVTLLSTSTIEPVEMACGTCIPLATFIGIDPDTCECPDTQTEGAGISDGYSVFGAGSTSGGIKIQISDVTTAAALEAALIAAKEDGCVLALRVDDGLMVVGGSAGYGTYGVNLDGNAPSGISDDTWTIQGLDWTSAVDVCGDGSFVWQATNANGSTSGLSWRVACPCP